MGIIRVNQLPEGSGSLSNDDIFVFMDDPLGSGITKKISLSQIGSIIGGGGGDFSGYFNTSLVAGNGVSFVYDSGNSTLTISSSNPKLFGSFYDTTTQTNISSSGVNTISYNSTLISSGISVVSGDRITFSKNAHYNIQFSLQYEKTDSGDDTIDLWLSKTGVYEPWSNTSVSVLGNNGKTVASWNFIIQANSGDYYQLHWHSPDTNMKLLAQTGLINPTRPDIPSVILTAIEI